jgi:hypothetical protein
MKCVLLAAVVAGTAIAAVPAQAAPVITFTNGVYALSPTSGAAVFENFDGGTVGSSYATSPQATPGAAGVTETSTGDNMIETGTAAGNYVDPTPNGMPGTGTPNFLGVEPGGSFSINFAAPVQYFSFIVGSLDNYNSLTLNFAGGSSMNYIGSEIVGLASMPVNSAGNSDPSLGGRVSFDTVGGPAISSVTFSTTKAAFEIDEIAASVPEPATWGMMMLGVGALGFAMRRQRKGATIVRFA